MAFPANPAERVPRADHNRRLDLGLDPDIFAAEAGITAEELRQYELTDHGFDLEVARRIGEALERLEANPPPSQKVVT